MVAKALALRVAGKARSMLTAGIAGNLCSFTDFDLFDPAIAADLTRIIGRAVAGERGVQPTPKRDV